MRELSLTIGHFYWEKERDEASMAIYEAAAKLPGLKSLKITFGGKCKSPVNLMDG